MSKVKAIWNCISCGYSQAKWGGQCPQCENWNTLQEGSEQPVLTRRFESQNTQSARPMRLKEVDIKKIPRIISKVKEFDRLMGGGVIPGALTLVGGDPGIGKSTLMLQLAEKFAVQGLTVLYVCGEESVEQTSIRAKRLGVQSENLLLLNETEYGAIRARVEETSPDILIVDSIQIVYKGEVSSAPGSVVQVRETTAELMHLSKNRHLSTFLIGHVTKSGEIAGPKILEHLVDTVLYFEGNKKDAFRMVRVVKNRFGPTDEIAIFQMGAQGLEEVQNPSQLFLEERKRGAIGSAIIPTIEGVRPILVEVQALVTKTAFSTPSRRCTGLDQKRLALLLAVLEKRLGCPLYQWDVFVSVAGGLRIMEPAIDLGITLAVASSFKNIALDPETAIVGEVGLGGEIRSVPRLEQRLKEASLLGFQRCIIPKQNMRGLSKQVTNGIQVIPVESLEQTVKIIFKPPPGQG